MLRARSCLLGALVLLGGAMPSARAADRDGALDGGAPRPPRPTFKWDVPGVVSTVDIPGITWAMGVPVKMHAVTVKGKIDDSMRYLYDSFVRQGLFVEARLQLGPMLTGVDPDTLMTYTAIFQENAPGFVTVVLGEANIPQMKPPPGTDFVPLFPGARGVLRNSFEGTDTLVYFAPIASVDKVRAFYEEILPQAGYQTDPSEPLLFKKPGQQVSLQLKPTDGNVSVFVTRRGAAP